MIGAYFSISILVVLFIFAIVFFRKNKLNNLDTRIYSFILIASIFGTIIDILTFILFKSGFDYNSSIYKLFTKMEFIYFFYVLSLFTIYTYVSIKNDNPFWNFAYDALYTMWN